MHMEQVAATETHVGHEAVHARGFVKRAENFESVNMLAEQFEGDPHYASIRAGSLVGGAFTLVEPDLPGKAEKVLHVLVQHTPREAWKSGKVIKCTLSNARIAGLCGINKRSVVRLLALLEERGWLVRRYTRANQRYGAGGIDLRPLARRLPELEAAYARFNDELREERERLHEERLDIPAPVESAEDPEPDKVTSASRHDTSDNLNLYNKTSGLTDLVQEQAEGCRPCPPPLPTQAEPEASDKDLVCLMAEASPTLQRQLAPAHLSELLCGEPSHTALQDVSRSIGWLVRQYVRIRPEAWQKAVERHGWAALAAVLVAVDRQGIKNPGAYLFSMLQSSILRRTVHHNLRSLCRQGGGHA